MNCLLRVHLEQTCHSAVSNHERSMGNGKGLPTPHSLQRQDPGSHPPACCPAPAQKVAGTLRDCSQRKQVGLSHPSKQRLWELQDCQEYIQALMPCPAARKTIQNNVSSRPLHSSQHIHSIRNELEFLCLSSINQLKRARELKLN